MNQLTGITNNAKQVMRVILEDGSVAELTLTYLGATQRWAFSIDHPNLTVYNKILCTHPNILRQYKHVIPFGLMCLTTDGLDPTMVTDFKTGRSQLYILQAADIAAVETAIGDLVL